MSAPLRIAYLLGGFPRASETFIARQIGGIVARGHHVDILATGDGVAAGATDEVERLRLLVRRIDPPRDRLLRFLRVALLTLRYGWRIPGVVLRSLNVARYGKSAASLELLHAALVLTKLGTRRYDIIHAQFGTFGPLAVRLVETGALRGNVVASFRGYDASLHLRAHPRAYNELFAGGRLFLPVSAALANRIIAAGADPARVRVHHSGIDCSGLPWRERARAGDEPTRVVTIGRFVEKKGIAYGIQAVARARAAGRALAYTIVGEGPLRADLERLVAELGIGEHVRIVDWQSHADLVALLDRQHLLIAPSVTAADGDQEGIPNVLKEAMAMGLPVIGTRHAGIPELIEDGVSGHLVAERDAAALAERLIDLVDHPERWAALGRRGRERVCVEFDIQTQSDVLARLYQSLCAASA